MTVKIAALAPSEEVISLSTHAPLKYLQTLFAFLWGGGAFHPLAICQTTGPTLYSKTTFISLWHGHSEYTTEFYVKVTVDVTCNDKGQIFLPAVIACFAEQISRSSLKQSR